MKAGRDQAMVLQEPINAGFGHKAAASRQRSGIMHAGCFSRSHICRDIVTW
jgi:hypothetical protein